MRSKREKFHDLIDTKPEDEPDRKLRVHLNRAVLLATYIDRQSVDAEGALLNLVFYADAVDLLQRGGNPFEPSDRTTAWVSVSTLAAQSINKVAPYMKEVRQLPRFMTFSPRVKEYQAELLEHTYGIRVFEGGADIYRENSDYVKGVGEGLVKLKHRHDIDGLNTAINIQNAENTDGLL